MKADIRLRLNSKKEDKNIKIMYRVIAYYEPK